jgi:hypothetical protein
MQCTWIFSTPYSTVLTINVSTQTVPCFVRKIQIVQHINPLYKNHVADYRITAQVVADRTEARKWTCAERLGKCLKCPLQRGREAASYIHVAAFIDVWSLGCVVYGTRFISQVVLFNGSCHRNTPRPQVDDGGVRLQVWRKLWIYWISSHGLTTMGSPLCWRASTAVYHKL